jgi:hypothetical protein
MGPYNGLLSFPSHITSNSILIELKPLIATKSYIYCQAMESEMDRSCVRILVCLILSRVTAVTSGSVTFNFG